MTSELAKSETNHLGEKHMREKAEWEGAAAGRVVW